MCAESPLSEGGHMPMTRNNNDGEAYKVPVPSNVSLALARVVKVLEGQEQDPAYAEAMWLCSAETAPPHTLLAKIRCPLEPELVSSFSMVC